MNKHLNSFWASLSTRKIFVIFFILILIYALFFRWALIHFLPILHGGSGLIAGDNVLFHKVAVAMAEDISSKGWGEWKLFSLNTAATLNVGIASIIYYFFGSNPAFVIPVNALVQSAGAALLYKIILQISSNKKAAFLSALTFSLMPTTLIWVSQLHKDGYAIFAWFLALYSIIQSDSDKNLLKCVLMNLAAMALMFMTRPLYLNLVIVIFLIDLLYTLIFTKTKMTRILLPINIFVCLIFVASFYYFQPVINATANAFDATTVTLPANTNTDNYKFNWKENKSGLDRIFLQVSSMRINQIYFAGISNSLIDYDKRFESKKDFFKYIPRALEIAFLFPTPALLLHIGNAQAKIVLLEMLLYYFFLANLVIYFLRKKGNHVYYRILLFSASAATFLAYINPVIGSLHRVRYPFFILITSMGIIAALEHWQKLLNYLSSKR